MSLKFDSDTVPQPCHIPWEQMEGDAEARHCATCSTPVHNLSELTRAEAEAFIEGFPRSERLCVRYVFSEERDTVLFRDSPDPVLRLSRQIDGARRLLAAAALALPLLAACEPRPMPPDEASVVSPIRIEDQGASLAEPGAGLAPQAPSDMGEDATPDAAPDAELDEPMPIKIGKMKAPDSDPPRKPASDRESSVKVGMMERQEE